MEKLVNGLHTNNTHTKKGFQNLIAIISYVFRVSLEVNYKRCFHYQPSNKTEQRDSIRYEQQHLTDRN